MQIHKYLFISSTFYFFFVQGNMSPLGFERFPNYYFVETGTYQGDGIRFALRAQFPEIHSIEINGQFVKRARMSFSRYSNVFIWQGSSGIMLWEVIKSMDRPITFWLDGHNGVPDKSGGKNTPLMEELDQIKMHPIKIHTIVIDDMHCCGGVLFDYLTKEDIIRKIKEINLDYEIMYVDGGDDGEYANNIMVACVPSNKVRG